MEIQRDFASNTYMSPLLISDQGTLQKVIGAYDETLSLKIVASRMENGQRVDLLSGTKSAQGTVVGNTSYAVRCRAVVVNSVKRIDDLRAKK